MPISPPPPPNTNEDLHKPIKVYTMPEKFHVDDHGSSGGGSKLMIWLIVILAVVLLGVAGFLAYKKFMPSTNTTENTNEINANVAVNENMNGNANKNTNSAVNTNLNINVNSSINTNTAGNQNIFPNFNVNNTNTAFNANITPVVSSQDSDSDGLTDVEETLFSANPIKADTDGDSYADGQEVVGGYNPTGTGSIESSSALRTYYDPSYFYSILYPASWASSDDPQNTRGKMFTTSGEFVEASVQENPANLSARDWYLTQSPGVNSSQISSITNWDKTLSGVLSVDGLTAYFVSGQKVYIINYNLNILTQANYKSTFQMMYRSFKVGVVPVTTNTNANVNVNTNTVNKNSNSNTNTNTANTNSNLNSATNRL
ncbi:MAG: hypothetical protein WC544_00350 [Patescibacteria group bacterium]